MNEWQPIDTAPPGVRLLLWWIPVDGNVYAETCILGQLSDSKPGMYWDGQYPGRDWEKGYKSLDRITHWMLPPERPADRPPFEPSFTEHLRQQRESAMHYAQWKARQGAPPQEGDRQA
jgi:hypothetical protein